MDQFGSVKPNIYCWDCLKWLQHQIFNSQWLILLLHFSLSVFIYSLESFIHSCSCNRTTEVIWFNFLGLKTTDGVCVRWWLGHCVIDFDFLSICSAQPGDKHPTTAIKMWKMLPATNWFTFEKGPNCPVLLHFNHQCRNHHEHWTGVNCQRPKFNVSVFYVTATKTLEIQIHPCPHSRWHAPKKRKKKEVQNQAQIWCCTLLHCNALVHSWFCGSTCSTWVTLDINYWIIGHKYYRYVVQWKCVQYSRILGLSAEEGMLARVSAEEAAVYSELGNRSRCYRAALL